MEWEAIPKNYWVWVNADNRVRVPRWSYFKLVPPDSQLELARNKNGELTHPFYLVRWLLWGFGVASVVLLINGISLFIIEEAFVPSWLEWTGIN